MEVPTLSPPPMTRPRVYKSTELSSADYHAEREHVSSSQLVHVLKTPAHYLAKTLECEDEESDLMRMGSGMHCVVLEPSEFSKRYILAPRTYNRTKTIDKEELATIARLYPNQTLVAPKEAATIERMVRGIRADQRAQNLLETRGESECSIFWTDALTGLQLKARPDRIVFDCATNTLLEIKTTEDASERKFYYKILDMDYDTRAVMQADAVRQIYGVTPRIVWMVFERDTGFVALYEPSPYLLERGRRRYEEARIALAKAKASNYWPAYQTGESIVKIGPPTKGRY